MKNEGSMSYYHQTPVMGPHMLGKVRHCLGGFWRAWACVGHGTMSSGEAFATKADAIGWVRGAAR